MSVVLCIRCVYSGYNSLEVCCSSYTYDSEWIHSTVDVCHWVAVSVVVAECKGMCLTARCISRSINL